VLARYLLNDVEQITEPFILALDDVHLIREQAILDFLSELLHHPSRSMSLVLIGRRDPSVPIASLRAHRQVTEIRVWDLRFTPQEAARLLGQLLHRKIDGATASDPAALHRVDVHCIDVHFSPGLFRQAVSSSACFPSIGSSISSRASSNPLRARSIVSRTLRISSKALFHSSLSAILARSSGPGRGEKSKATAAPKTAPKTNQNSGIVLFSVIFYLPLLKYSETDYRMENPVPEIQSERLHALFPTKSNSQHSLILSRQRRLENLVV
jgi:hypothetical protein